MSQFTSFLNSVCTLSDNGFNSVMRLPTVSARLKSRRSRIGTEFRYRSSRTTLINNDFFNVQTGLDASCCMLDRRLPEFIFLRATRLCIAKVLREFPDQIAHAVRHRAAIKSPSHRPRDFILPGTDDGIHTSFE